MSEEVDKSFFVLVSTLVKVNGKVIPSGYLAEFVVDGVDAFLSVVSSINQVAVDGTLELDLGYGKQTLKEVIEESIHGYDTLPRITKEQFYTLE